MSREDVDKILDLSLWGSGPYGVSLRYSDKEVVINHLVHRLTEIRRICEQNGVIR